MVLQLHLRLGALACSGEPRVGVLPTAMGELRLLGTSSKRAQGWRVPVVGLGSMLAPKGRRYPRSHRSAGPSALPQPCFAGTNNTLDRIREGGRLERGLSPEAHP